MKTEKSKKDIISTIYFSASVAMIFTQIAGYAATMIDGIITSRAIGPDAYSAISLLVPFTGIVTLLAGSISTGGQVVCSSLVGVGKKDEANATFALSILLSLFVAGLIVAGCILFPKELFAICGVSLKKKPELYPYMLSYLKGYMVGIPAMMTVLIIGPMIVMDNNKKLFTASAFFLCIVDVIGDLVNAYGFKGGTFGMGLASAIAFYLQLLFLLTHFLKKNTYFRISFSGMKLSSTIEIIRAGTPAFVRKFSTTLRDLLTNRINLMVALSTAAVAARGMQSDLNTILFCIGLGLGKTIITMAGVHYSANDRAGLTKLFSYAMKLSVIFAGGAAIIAFIAAPALAHFYTNDPEVVELSVFSIRCMAIGLVPDTVSVVFQNYLQGIKNRKVVNAMNFGERLIIPVGTALVLGLLYGSKGIMASVAVGKFILMFIMFIYFCIHAKGFPHHISDFMLVSKDFGGKSEDNIYATIRSMDDVIAESKAAEEFCAGHGISPEKSKMMGLFVEEMAGNIIEHGKPIKKDDLGIDYRLYADDGKIALSIRDYCEEFDPTAYYEAHHSDDPESMIGIRMVTKMAKEFHYYNAFNSNNVLIYLE